MGKSLQIFKLSVTAFQQNCRVLVDSDSRLAVLVDPGGDAPKILAFLKRESLSLSAIWLTHSHLDHCGAVASIVDEFEIPIFAHPQEIDFRVRVEEIATMYGLEEEGMSNCPEPTNPIVGGEVLQFESHSFRVLFTPGHSPGHLCFYSKENEVLLAGDTLFQGSIGRTDLPGGNHKQLLSSIKQSILTLPGRTRVLSGHGPDTTVEAEMANNPFIGGGR